MRTDEVDRLKVIQDILQGRLRQWQAAEQLDLSRRQVIRVCQRVRAEGARGIVHASRGRPSNNQLNPGILTRALALVKARYPDFGPTLANEKLLALHSVALSTTVLRLGMVQEGLWQPRKHKNILHRAWRPRRACLGELTQLDGSPHDWFEGRGPVCTLLAYIDDATSKVLWARFVAAEDTVTLMRVTRDYLRRYGRPVAYYVDKDSIYKVNREATIEEELRDCSPISQFTRAMTELGITVICANSPQAKGRVERGFKTHQDRLVKELRLAKISTMAAANVFLDEVYLPDHNRRCAVPAANRTDAHRRLLPEHRLDEILSRRVDRTLLNDFTLRFQNKFLQLLRQQPLRLRPKAKIQVEIRLDGSMHLRFGQHYLRFKTIDKRHDRPYFVANALEAPKGILLPPRRTPLRPAKDHPWRRSFKSVRQQLYDSTTFHGNGILPHPA
jgi:hypothetical protein